MSRKWWIIFSMLAVGHLLLLAFHADESSFKKDSVRVSQDQLRSIHARVSLLDLTAHSNSAHHYSHNTHHCAACDLSLVLPGALARCSFKLRMPLFVEDDSPSPIAPDGIHRPPILSRKS